MGSTKKFKDCFKHKISWPKIICEEGTKAKESFINNGGMDSIIPDYLKKMLKTAKGINGKYKEIL